MKLRSPLLAFVLGAAIAGASTTARATIVERVVAVVGERPILWTDLVHRALASRVQIRQQTHDPNVIAVQEQELYKELLDRMIDDRLEEQQADKAHVAATPDEIDRGLSNIASQAQAQQGRPVTVADVLSEVHRRGMTEQDFRDELRRQILEGKLIELRVRPRVRITEEDARTSYQRWVKEIKDEQPMDLRILALRVLPTSTATQVDARMALARELVARARTGEDFCQLVTQYSDDIPTRTTCGSRGAQPLGSLPPPIQDAVHSMQAGSISDPIPVRLAQEEAIVIVQPLGQARVPAFDDVKNDMMQRAMLDGIERARKQWLQELRHNVYIDVRL